MPITTLKSLPLAGILDTNPNAGSRDEHCKAKATQPISVGPEPIVPNNVGSENAERLVISSVMGDGRADYLSLIPAIDELLLTGTFWSASKTVTCPP